MRLVESPLAFWKWYGVCIGDEPLADNRCCTNDEDALHKVPYKLRLHDSLVIVIMASWGHSDIHMCTYIHISMYIYFLLGN